MAALPPSRPWNGPVGDFDFTTQDYAIGGKMVRVSATMSEEFSMHLATDYEARERIKEDISIKMAKFMLENKLVEINQMTDPSTMGIVVVARCYLAPNDQVKILRTMAR